jgi:predicted solute-binding protein
MSVTSMDVNGVSVTIDSKVFLGYVQESNRILDAIEELKKDFKEVVESVVESTKLEKKDVNKYLKAKYKLATKEPKAQADLFEVLDEIVSN